MYIVPGSDQARERVRPPVGRHSHPRSGKHLAWLVIGALVLASGCRHSGLAGSEALDAATEPSETNYPVHWWQPVPESETAWWEIPPQDAGPGEVILSKRNELGLLSNFAATPFVYRGRQYASLEGLWQSMKYPEAPHDPRARHPDITWEHSREDVMAMTAFEAHEAGEKAEANMAVMGIDWITFEGERIQFKGDGQARHYQIIEEATRAKVRQNPQVRAVLLTTGSLVLRPDHITDESDPPAWRYYDLYMKIRAELAAADGVR